RIPYDDMETRDGAPGGTTIGLGTVIRAGKVHAQVVEPEANPRIPPQLSTSASYTFIRLRFRAPFFAALAVYCLVRHAVAAVPALGVAARVGTLFSAATFFQTTPSLFDLLAPYLSLRHR
ncbi:hypothetical protein DM086_30120, partial [Klebsiella pneumoniae]